MPERATRWVCPSCGKQADDRHDFGDVACYLAAVLVYVDTILEDVHGRVRSAEAVTESLPEG